MDLEYENGKQLQVTIAKITESKENKSSHRFLWLIRSRGGELPPFPLPPPR